MARFYWRLQRVLDIREKEEQVLRSELSALNEQTLLIRQEIMVIRSRLHSILDDLADRDPGDRIIDQQMFLNFAKYSEQQIAELKAGLENIEKQKEEKMQQVLEKRKAIKALEKLRAKAKHEFIANNNRLTQHQLDEFAGNRFTHFSLQKNN